MRTSIDALLAAFRLNAYNAMALEMGEWSDSELLARLRKMDEEWKVAK